MRNASLLLCLLVPLAAGCTSHGSSGEAGADAGPGTGTGSGGAPAIPYGLTVGSATSSSLAVSWTSDSGAASYQLFRDTSASGSFSDKVYDGAATSFTDTGLTASTTYYYEVQASNAAGTSALSAAASGTTAASGTDFTAAQVLTAIQAHMTASDQVNTKPHINTMTRDMNVNVYQVTTGVYVYSSSMAVDTDGSDADPDPDHQSETTWMDDNGDSLGAHHVPYYVLGDYCYDKTTPCPHFFYGEHDIAGLQFALIFYNGKVIGAVFGDTQGDSVTPTSDNDSRELGEASVESASLLGIPSSGTTGGVDSGVTVVIFSGASWVVHGTNSTLNANAQAKVQQALDLLGARFAL